MAEIFVGIPWGQDKVTTTTRREHPLGQLGLRPDGAIFRWGFSGEAIGAGQLTMQTAPVADHDMDLATQTAASVGDTTYSVTLGATAATEDQYEDGFIYINDGPGEGHLYRIKSNPAADASDPLTVTLHEKVREATTTADSLAGLIPNPYKDVEIWDADDIDGDALGVAPTEVADDEFFWDQVTGDAAVLIDGTVVLGEEVMGSDNADGAVEAQNYGAAVENPTVGVASSVVAVTTDFGHIRCKMLG